MKLPPKKNDGGKPIQVEALEIQFCQMWPQAKHALELLISIENNPAASLILSTVKAAGDAVVRKANN